MRNKTRKKYGKAAVGKKKKNKKPQRRSSSSEAPPSQQSLFAMQSEYHVGPIPSPKTLSEYEEIHPGFANRIIEQFEKQGEHRREIEKQLVANDEKRSKRRNREVHSAQVGALSISLSVIYLAYTQIIMGHEVLGFILGASGIASIVTAWGVSKKTSSE